MPLLFFFSIQSQMKHLSLWKVGNVPTQTKKGRDADMADILLIVAVACILVSIIMRGTDKN